MATWLDDYWPLQHRVLVDVSRQLRHTSVGAAMVGHLCVAEELPACASRTVPSSRGSPRLRDGRAVSQTTQNVDGTQQDQGGMDYVFSIFI